MVREGRIFTSTAGSGRPAFGSGLMVNVLAPGAQVTQGSVSTTITVAAGHGFSAGDKYMVGTDLNTYSGALSVLSVTATTLEFAAIRPVASGDLIVNLGPDTGVSEPIYDGNSVTVYIDPDYQNAFVNGLVWADANGRYRYHHRGIARWEIVRNSLTPIAIYIDTGSQAGGSGWPVNVRDFGAIGDGVTDDTISIQAAVDSMPEGGRVWFPQGTYAVTSTIRAFPGIYLEGDGPYATYIRALPSFSGTSIVQFKNPLSDGTFVGTVTEGIGMRMLTVHCDGVNAHGINVFRGYDGVTFDTVHALNVGDTVSGFRFEPDLSNTSGSGFVSQTITIINTYSIHKNGGPGVTGAVYSFEACQEMSLLNCKSLGGYSASVATLADCFYFQDCRGVSATGISCGLTGGNAIHIVSSNTHNAACTGLYFHGTTFEACVRSVLAEGYAPRSTKHLRFDGNRSQVGLLGGVAAVAGPFEFKNCEVVSADIPGFELIVDSACLNCRFSLLDMAHVLSNEGTRIEIDSRYRVDADTTLQWLHRSMNHPIELRAPEGDVSGPILRLAHADRDGHYLLFWSAAEADDFGLQIRHVTSDGTSKYAAVFESNAGALLYHDNVEKVRTTANGVTVTGGIVSSGPSTLILRTITVDPTSVATAGTIGEVVYSSSTAKFYGKHTASATDTNWRLMGT